MISGYPSYQTGFGTVFAYGETSLRRKGRENSLDSKPNQFSLSRPLTIKWGAGKGRKEKMTDYQPFFIIHSVFPSPHSHCKYRAKTITPNG
jgi:hypothetical protein